MSEHQVRTGVTMTKYRTSKVFHHYSWFHIFMVYFIPFWYNYRCIYLYVDAFQWTDGIAGLLIATVPTHRHTLTTGATGEHITGGPCINDLVVIHPTIWLSAGTLAVISTHQSQIIVFFQAVLGRVAVQIVGKSYCGRRERESLERREWGGGYIVDNYAYTTFCTGFVIG